MGFKHEDKVKAELRELFNEDMIMDTTKVTEYLGTTKANVLLHSQRGNLVPIYEWRAKRIFRLFYYPDIVKFERYKAEKKKNDSYALYHKEIQTRERKRIELLLAEYVWVASQVCDFLNVPVYALNTMVSSKRLSVFGRPDNRRTRLFFAPEVKKFKIKYDSYIDYLENK